MMHSAIDLHHIGGLEPKRSFNGFPLSQSSTITNHIISANNNHNNIPTNNSTISPPHNGQNNFHLLQAPRPLRRCRSASPVPHQLPTMNGLLHHHQLLSTEQQALIRKSWQKIPKGTFGSIVFEKMLERSPAIERMFTPDPSAIQRHERYFAELAQWAVDGMADPERMLSNWLEMLGRGHGQFRVKRAHWDYLGEALTEAICQSATITGRQRRETVHAWRILLSFLADRLGNPTPASPESFNRIHLLQLVSDGPRPHQQVEDREHQQQKTP